MRNLVIIVLVLISTVSCNNNSSVNKKQATDQGDQKDSSVIKEFTLVSPQKYAQFKIGEQMNVQLQVIDSLKKIDSVRVYLGNTLYKTQPGVLSFPVTIGNESLGKQNFSVTAFFSNKTQQTENLEVMVLSDIVPISIPFKVLNVYPHSSDNYTEGLLFDGNILYEGTGEEGKSKVLKTELKTGKVLQDLSIDPAVFGEGIAVINDKLYELTYRSKIGYVYDKKTLRLIRKFKYTFDTEGWGMTTDGKDLIMSNGTDRIFVLDTSYMNMIREIKVCDNTNSVDSLNELEYVHGIIYANIWITNKIAKIDFKTGKVLGYIDLTSIIPQEEKGKTDNVLNGIAYQPSTGSLFITGKRWKKLFEIKLEK
jgi:glutaminyl-peptide cyclotransferase